MKRFAPVILLAVLVALLAIACKDVPIDDERNDARLFVPKGVIRGTVTYLGPRPCSAKEHIVGNAILLVFNRRNPPPPQGMATSAVNFVAVPGDILFANEPRSVSNEITCPPDSPPIEASAPFTIAPLDAGSYVIAAFYDRRGRFWPTFRFRNLPEAGDYSGGFIDVEDARLNTDNLGYEPKFLPVNVGIPQPAAANEIPDYVINENGFVADNVPVTISRPVPFTRPYFHPVEIEPATLKETDSPEVIGEGFRSPANETADPLAVPVIALPQDVKVLAPPTNANEVTLTAYQRSFPHIKLTWGVTSNEVEDATDPRYSFGFQLPALPPRGKGGLLVFSRGRAIPENPLVPDLWPQVALVKLADDPLRTADPQSLVVQGTPEETEVTGKAPGPLVVIQGITLDADSLPKTIAGSAPATATTAALRDHVTSLVRPAALCLDPRRVDLGGVLVTPHLNSPSADPAETGDKPIFDATALKKNALVREVKRGCLPMGRYAVTLVYPSGQAWTVPNETGSCAPSEGGIFVGQRVSSCVAKQRPVLLSQGARAVVEIIGPRDEATCANFPVPTECLP